MSYQLMHYILVDRRVVECADLIQWAKWMELSRKDDSFRVGQTDIGEYWVSTVFLGLDHNYSNTGPPVLFETMVFSSKGEYNSDERMQRYCTYEEAERGHNRLVEILRLAEALSGELTSTTLNSIRLMLRDRE